MADGLPGGRRHPGSLARVARPDSLTLTELLTADGLDDLRAAGAILDRAKPIEREAMVRLLQTRGLVIPPSIFDLEALLSRLRFRRAPLWTTGVIATIAHLSSQPRGEAYLARVGERGLVPFACGGDSVHFLDEGGVVHHDLDIEYFGPVAERWTLWLERQAWDMIHAPQEYNFAFLVEHHSGEPAAAALGASRLNRISDEYETLWDAPAGMVRERRIRSRDAGTSVLTHEEEDLAAVLLALHECQERPLVHFRWGRATAALTVKAQERATAPDSEPVALRGRGKVAGLYPRDEGELVVLGRPGHYRIELRLDHGD
jgi:hypothetical protein